MTYCVITTNKPYHVAFRAKLFGIGFIKLAESVIIQGHIAKLYKQLNSVKCVQEWEDSVSQLKSETYLQKNYSQTSLLTDSLEA